MKYIETIITKSGGVITPSDLKSLGEKITQVLTPEDYTSGVVIGGRMPVWAYAYITHLLHPTKSVGIYDPRLGGGVVVASHDATTKVKVGDIVSPTEKVTVEF